MTKTFYVLRHKGTNNYFRWHELCEDGWGIYVADANFEDSDDLPSFFETPKIREFVDYHKTQNTRADKISESDIEVVPVTITI
jgi:hypothetical protein